MVKRGGVLKLYLLMFSILVCSNSNAQELIGVRSKKSGVYVLSQDRMNISTFPNFRSRASTIKKEGNIINLVHDNLSGFF